MAGSRLTYFCQSLTAVGSFTIGIRNPKGRGLAFQLDCASANVDLLVTNAFSFDNATGTLFAAPNSLAGLPQTSSLTANAMFVLPHYAPFAAYRLHVKSCAGHVTAIIAE